VPEVRLIVALTMMHDTEEGDELLAKPRTWKKKKPSAELLDEGIADGGPTPIAREHLGGIGSILL
jgi:hypothetical protein